MESGAPAADALNVGSQVDQSASLQEGVTPEQAEATHSVAKAEAKRIRELKLKVHGEELTEELPFEIEEDPEVIPALCYTFKCSAGGYDYKDKVLESHIFESEQNFFDKMDERARIPQDNEEACYTYWTGTIADQTKLKVQRQNNDQE